MRSEWSYRKRVRTLRGKAKAKRRSRYARVKKSDRCKAWAKES